MPLVIKEDYVQLNQRCPLLLISPGVGAPIQVQILQLHVRYETSESIHQSPLNPAIRLVGHCANKVEISGADHRTLVAGDAGPQVSEENELLIVILRPIDANDLPRLPCFSVHTLRGHKISTAGRRGNLNLIIFPSHNDASSGAVSRLIAEFVESSTTTLRHNIARDH